MILNGYDPKTQLVHNAHLSLLVTNCHSTSSDRNKTSESAFDMESESDLEKDLIRNVESESDDDDTKINHVQRCSFL